jgi:hypothetical protein
MAGLRSAKELRKWQNIQREAEAPLARVLDGSYAKKDVDLIGAALKNYDDLAYSVFAEGLRTVEAQTQVKLQSIQETRVRRNKKPLTARQLSILNEQATEHAMKTMMPQLVATVQEMLGVQSKSLEEIVHEPEKKPHLGIVSNLSLKKFILDKFKVMDAANDTPKKGSLLDRIRQMDADAWKDKLTDIKRLLGKPQTSKKSSTTAPEPDSKPGLVSRFLSGVQDAKASVATKWSSTKQAVSDKVQAVTSAPGRMMAAARNYKDSAVSKVKSFFTRPVSATPQADASVEAKSPDSEEKKPRSKKDAALAALEYVKTKYGRIKDRAGKIASGLQTMGMIAVGLMAVVPFLKGIIKSFKDIDVMALVKDVFFSAVDWVKDLDIWGYIKKAYELTSEWVVDKVCSFLGIDRKKLSPEEEKARKEQPNLDGSYSDGTILPEAPKPVSQVEKGAAATGATTATPPSGSEGSASASPAPAATGSENTVAKPAGLVASGGMSSSSPMALKTPASGAAGIQTAQSPNTNASAPQTSSPGSVAKPATTASTQAPSQTQPAPTTGTGGSTVAVLPNTRGIPSTGVVAKPEKVAAQQAQAPSTQGIPSGTNKVTSASCPTHSMRNECSSFLNATGVVS